MLYQKQQFTPYFCPYNIFRHNSNQLIAIIMKDFKKTLNAMLLCIIFSSIGTVLFGQNVAITDDDAYNAHASAMLDVKSVNKGLLIPRLTTAQRLAISPAATGLMVFDTDFGRFFYYTGSGWADNSAEGLWKKTSNRVYLGTATDLVGIGINTPAHKLHVRHGVNNTAGTNGNAPV
jgi:hypothetical protein